MRVWRVISGPVWMRVWEVDSGVNSGQSEVILGPYLGNLIILLRKAFIWPWVGPYLRYMLNMGPGMGPGGVPV